MIRKWDSKNNVLQRKCIDEIIARVDKVGDATFGVIAAQDVIDIVTEHLAPEIYNRGIADAQKLVTQKLVDLEIDIDNLEQRIA